MNLNRIAIPFLVLLLAFGAACGGDDDDTATSDTTGSSGSTNAAPAEPTAAGDSQDGDSSATSGSSSDGGSRTVTIGGDTWTLVPDQCDAANEGGIPLFTIAGHAEEDDAIEIVINFDPRDTGLEMTVTGPGDDPSWTADPGITVQAGVSLISGEGAFSSATGETAQGSFKVVC